MESRARTFAMASGTLPSLPAAPAGLTTAGLTPAGLNPGRALAERNRRLRDRAREEQRMPGARGGAWIRAPTGFFTFSPSL